MLPGIVNITFLVAGFIWLVVKATSVSEDLKSQHSIERKLIVVSKGYCESGDGKCYSRGKYVVARDIRDSSKWIELDSYDLGSSGDEDSIFYNSNVNDTITIKNCDLRKRFFTKLAK